MKLLFTKEICSYDYRSFRVGLVDLSWLFIPRKYIHVFNSFYDFIPNFSLLF